MPQTLSSREDLKTDLLQKWIHQILEWIANHRQTFFSIAGTLLVIAAVVAFIISNFKNLRTQAWEKYSAGQTWALTSQPENGLNLFNEVIQNYSHTPAATYALLSKGDILFRQKKFQAAPESYKQCLEKEPPQLILPFAFAGLGACQENQGDYASSIISYKKFISDFPEHFLAPKIYESLGRVYELSLNPDAAKETYEKIITVFPSTIWSEKARARYQILSPQPFQNQTPPVQETK
ncbi:MAG: tetratricopeptide repeat protein [Elusimicrobia bacterium]|nr:tetratricopeptide repeat protein [Elusimicrobiota bacterium]